jgi:hypothetical protein
MPGHLRGIGEGPRETYIFVVACAFNGRDVVGRGVDCGGAICSIACTDYSAIRKTVDDRASRTSSSYAVTISIFTTGEPTNTRQRCAYGGHVHETHWYSTLP